ncbi:MAG: hypothetical protein ACWA41_07415 [Putridiphycobacter sp.]
MKYLVFAGLILTLLSCEKTFTHERYIKNLSLDTLTVVNPDFEETHYVFPGESKLIYSYQNLDNNNGEAACQWEGDTLMIQTIHGVSCDKATTFESNWLSVYMQTEDGHSQKCTFEVDSTNF